MVKSGDEIVNPAGGKIRFCKTAADTDGDMLEVEVFYPPQSSPPPEHYHPYQEERFQVVKGVIRAQVGESLITYEEGDEFIIPAGVRHWMHNVSEEQSHLIWQTRPALNTETFFETMWGLIRDGKTNSSGVPNLLHLAVILQAHAREFRPSKPPYWVQKLLFGLLAPMGRIFGYKSSYSRASAPRASHFQEAYGYPLICISRYL